jgi:hypothetical protein
MTTLAITHPTLLDVTNRWDPQGRIDAIAEIQQQTNDGDRYLVYVEANEATSHKTTARVGIPVPTWRKLNGAAAITKTQTAQIRATIGMLEDWSEVDREVAKLNGNTAAWQLSEQKGKIQALSNEKWRAFFYGDESVNPEQITGLVSYYNDTSAKNSNNIILGPGTLTSNCTSIWVLDFSPETIMAIYPKGSDQSGSPGGLEVEDFAPRPSETAPDGSTGRLVVLSTRFGQKFGVCVRDWRWGIRIRVLTSALTGDAASGADLVDLLTQAVERFPGSQQGRRVILCNWKVKSFLRRQIVNKVKNSTLTMETVGGRKVMAFAEDIPVERCDAILNTESV